MDDLFATIQEPAGPQIQRAGDGRTYHLRGDLIAWREPGGRRGVVGGKHSSTAAALAAVEHVEAARAARGG